jgi:methionyl-tRNA synthetase
MIAKNCSGVVPRASTSFEDALPELSSSAILPALEATMAELALHRALETIWEGVAAANRYFAEQAPWALRKTDPAAADSVLAHAAEAVRRLAILARWAMPSACDRLLDQLGQGEGARDLAALATPIAPGTALPPPQGVFPRLEL